jgi:hypothetical protein
MITIFCDFWQFSAKMLRSFFLQKLAVCSLSKKTPISSPNLSAKFFLKIITPVSAGGVTLGLFLWRILYHSASCQRVKCRFPSKEVQSFRRGYLDQFQRRHFIQNSPLISGSRAWKKVNSKLNNIRCQLISSSGRKKGGPPMQGCQIFIVATYQNLRNLPNDQKIYLLAINYTIWLGIK